MFRIIALPLVVAGQAALAGVALPDEDRKGTADTPLLKRYEGAYIVAQERKAFAEFTLPLSKLEQVEGERTAQNNARFRPASARTLEGRHVRTVYVIPADRTPLEVARNYEQELRAAGGNLLFQCKEADCGGDPSRSLGGGGGRMSLSMFLHPPDALIEPRGTPGRCAIEERITDQRYAAFELPSAGAHVSVLAYRVASGRRDACRALNGRTVAVVDVLESGKREQRMVAVRAREMQGAIAETGRVALYGIHFDFNKADVRPESRPTLEEIAKLLRQSKELKLLIVGHTDNVGTFSFNMGLSEQRAAAVVQAISAQHGTAQERLTPVGVSFASPVASNKTEEGRARNRRVELVEH